MKLMKHQPPQREYLVILKASIDLATCTGDAARPYATRWYFHGDVVIIEPLYLSHQFIRALGHSHIFCHQMHNSHRSAVTHTATLHHETPDCWWHVPVPKILTSGCGAHGVIWRIWRLFLSGDPHRHPIDRRPVLGLDLGDCAVGATQQ